MSLSLRSDVAFRDLRRRHHVSSMLQRQLAKNTMSCDYENRWNPKITPPLEKGVCWNGAKKGRRYLWYTLRGIIYAWHSPERNRGDKFLWPGEIRGEELGEELGEILDEIFWAFSCFMCCAERPTEISPKLPPNLSLRVLSRLLWLKSQNFISASFWGLGRLIHKNFVLPKKSLLCFQQNTAIAERV